MAGKKRITQSARNHQLGKTSVALLIATFIALIGMMFINWVTNSALRDQHDIVNYAIQLREASQYLTAEVRAFSATGNEEHFNNYFDELDNKKNRDKAIEGMKKIGITSAEEASIEEILSISNGLVPFEEDAMENTKKGDLQSAINYVYGEEYNTGIKEISDKTDTFINNLEARMAKKCNLLTFWVAVIEFLAFALIVLVIRNTFQYQIFVVRELIRPMSSIEKQMKEISAGNLSAEFELEADETEIGTLVGSIHKMKEFLKFANADLTRCLGLMAQENFDFEISEGYIGEFMELRESLVSILTNMNNTFGTILKTSDNVAAGSNQLAIAAQNLAEDNTKQSDEMDNIVRAIDALRERVETNAKEAEESAKIAKEAGANLHQSSEKMSKLKNAIGEIQEAAEKIGTITQTINDIAGQTNLLALNAAIEAARAGEAGKGFAVVADEVKNLASDSAEAVQDTDELIRIAIQTVKDGTDLADETMEAITKVMVGAEQAVKLMQEVSKSMDEQVSTFEEITDSVNQVADLVQSSSAIAEETAASSEEQSANVDTLNEMLSKFQLR